MAAEEAPDETLYATESRREAPVEGPPQTDIDSFVRSLSRQLARLFARVNELEAAAFRSVDRGEAQEQFERVAKTIADLTERTVFLQSELIGLQTQIAMVEDRIAESGSAERIPDPRAIPFGWTLIRNHEIDRLRKIEAAASKRCQILSEAIDS